LDLEIIDPRQAVTTQLTVQPTARALRLQLFFSIAFSAIAFPNVKRF